MLTSHYPPMTNQIKGCEGCRAHADLFPFTMAFQPVVHLPSRTVYAHEALVGASRAGGLYSALSSGARKPLCIDQACRVKRLS